MLRLTTTLYCRVFIFSRHEAQPACPNAGRRRNLWRHRQRK